MSEFSWDIQKAISAKLLDGQPEGERIIIPEIDDPVAILDDIPSETKYPYIVIGEETSIDNDTKDHAGTQHTITIHTWSRYLGMKEVKLMQKYVVDKLHEVDISFDHAEVINVRREFDRVMVEVDGITRHGISRFRIVVYNSEAKI